MTRRAPYPAVSLAEKVRLRRMLDRIWAPFLTPAEAKVVTFIFTTTVEWSKPCDLLKVSHFVEGFANGACATGLSDKTVRRALDTLERDGAIRRKRTPYGYVMALIWEWMPASVRAPRGRAAVPRKALSPHARAIPVALSQSREIGQNDRERSVKVADAYREEHTREVIPNNRPPDSDGPASFKRKTPGKDSYVDPLDLTNLRATWTAAVAEAFPDLTPPTWTKREDAQACLFVRVSDKAKRLNALDVLAWAARSWRTIIAARFAWMKERVPPVFPDVGFLLAFKGHFYDAWNDRERLRSEITMDGKDRRVRQSMHRGMAYEEAQKSAEDGDALARARMAVAEKERHLNEMLRRSEARGKPTLPERLARLAEPKAPRRGPVQPGCEGMPTSFDTATLGAFSGGFCTQVQMREAP